MSSKLKSTPCQSCSDVSSKNSRHLVDTLSQQVPRRYCNFSVDHEGFFDVIMKLISDSLPPLVTNSERRGRRERGREEGTVPGGEPPNDEGKMADSETKQVITLGTDEG